VLCVSADVGQGEEAVILVKSSRDLLSGLKEAQVPVDLGWVAENTSKGPCVCLVVRAQGADVGELVGEVYFDAGDEEDRRLVRLLGSQPRLQVAFLDEELDIAWLVALPWGEIRRLEAEQAWDRAEFWLERSPEYDFQGAKALFQESVGLDRLVERAFPS
jgi:hypothetical protein